MIPVITCGLGCGQVPGTTQAEFDAHYLNLHHHVPAEGRTPAQWERAAVQLIREAAASGRAFTIAEALAPIGDHPDPEQRQFINGRITGQLATEGVIRHAPIDATTSRKATSNSSLVRVWTGSTPTRQEGATAA